VTGDQQTATLPWSSCFDPKCSKRTQWTLEVTPEFPSSRSMPVRFFVKLEPRDPGLGLGTTVETSDQRPVLVEMPLVHHLEYATTMVLTPYLLTGDEGMQSLLKCRMNKRDAEGLSRADAKSEPDQP